MAPERSVVVPGRAHTPREVQVPRSHQDVGGWPLPARIVRQIRREVARTGRSLQRLEVRGAVIDNFDALGPPSPPSPKSPSPAAYDDTVLFKCKEEFDESEDQNDDDDEMMSRGEMKMEPMEGQGTEDSDLTSLSWLQDRNLLKSITLTKSENGELRPMSQQSIKSEASPTSDYLEESVTSEPGGDSSGSITSDHAPSVSPPLLIPQTHSRTQQNGYHNTSSSSSNNNKTNGNASKLKHPHNVPYNPMVHTQNKPPYSFSCLIFMAIEDSPVKALPVKEIYAWIVQHFPYFRNAPSGWKNSVRHNLSLNKCFQKVEKAPSLGKGSLWMVDDQYRSNLMQAFSRAPFHPCVPSAHPSPPAPSRSPLSPMHSHSTVQQQQESGVGVWSMSPVRGPKGAPNPQLFPFLARRLAATEPTTQTTQLNHSNHENSCDSMSDEVVAAAMVLALKHGPSVITPAMASYAIQDHTYSVATPSNNNSPPSPAQDSEGDEQRKTAEALLHLAGVTTSPLPYTQTQPSHRPRLLTRTPKRHNSSPPHVATTENNNHVDHTDYNLHSKIKRPRNHQAVYQHHLP